VGRYPAAGLAVCADTRHAMIPESTPHEETPEELEERLNEGLDETFPASDPVAVHHEDRGDLPDAESKTGQGR
jgi:hypothetical protein